VPVISLEPFFGSVRGGRVLPGTSAMLVSCAEGTAAIPVRRVLDVLSVPRARFEASGEGSGPLVPGSFRGPAGSVPLLDVPRLLLAVQAAARQACEALFARVEQR
jgi:chemotaxis signal transduction protein